MKRFKLIQVFSMLICFFMPMKFSSSIHATSKMNLTSTVDAERGTDNTTKGDIFIVGRAKETSNTYTIGLPNGTENIAYNVTIGLERMDIFATSNYVYGSYFYNQTWPFMYQEYGFYDQDYEQLYYIHNLILFNSVSNSLYMVMYFQHIDTDDYV